MHLHTHHVFRCFSVHVLIVIHMINMHILILHRSEQICLATSLILVQVAI